MESYTALIGTDLDLACEALVQGKLIGLPTETVYGLAANALDEAAVIKIFQAKQRPAFDPLIVHVSDIRQIPKYTAGLPEGLLPLAEQFMPGPLTLILPKKNIIPDLVSSGGPTVGIRIPAHPMALKLLQKLPFPLAAPSANPFGYISPTQASHVAKQLSHKVAYILDGGPCSIGVESTVVDATTHPIRILRKGGLNLELIAEKLGYWPQIQEYSSSNPKAPGMLESHYAPKKPFYLMPKQELINQSFEVSEAVLLFGEWDKLQAENIWQLSAQGDYAEAASKLFSYLRQLDEDESVRAIYAHNLPDIDLGRAINDRLRRAAAKV